MCQVIIESIRQNRVKTVLKDFGVKYISILSNESQGQASNTGHTDLADENAEGEQNINLLLNLFDKLRTFSIDKAKELVLLY